MATDPAAASNAAADAGKNAQAAQQPQNLLDTAAAKPADGKGAAVAANDGEWFWAEGVKGVGAAPDFWKKDKYKTLGEQAKAYVELEKEHGKLTAKVPKAPDKYEITVPDDLKEVVTFNAEDPLLLEFQTFAKEAGMSQDQFSKALHMLAKHEYSAEAIDIANEKKLLGDRADERIKNFETWARGHLSEEQFQRVFSTLGQRTRPSDVFSALEMILMATRQPASNMRSDDVQTGSMTLADVDAAWNKVNEKGQRLIDIDPAYRRKIREMRRQVVGDGDHIEIVGKRGER